MTKKIAEKTEISGNVLDEIETEHVQSFAENEQQMQAVKKYLLAVVYNHGVVEASVKHQGNKNWALQMAWGAINPNGMPRSDEELGQGLRAMAYAVQLIESAFKEISDIKKVVTLDEVIENPAE